MHHLVQPVEIDQPRVDGFAARRFLIKDRDIHIAEIGEDERARYRCRRHHQQVRRTTLAAEGEALVHAEAVLLIHHGQRQIGKGHIILKQRVGAHGNVDGAIGQTGEHGGALGRFGAAGQHGAAHARRIAQRFQPLKMLAGENIGGGHQRGLPPGLDRAGHRQQSDNGLARADIALQQAQHPLARRHVGINRGQSAGLRAGQRIRQGAQDLCGQSPVAHGRAACGGLHPAAHQHEGELAGQQFVIGQPHRGRGVGIRRGAIRRVDGAHRRIECGPALFGQQRRILPFRHGGQALQRGGKRGGNAARGQPLGQRIDRLERGQGVGVRHMQHPLGMRHLAVAIEQFDGAGDDPLGPDGKLLFGGGRCSSTVIRTVATPLVGAEAISGDKRRSILPEGR